MCPTDTRMNAILAAAHLVLVSCIPARCLKIEQGLKGKPTTSLSVDLRGEEAVSSSAEEILQLVKKALDDVIDRLGCATLLNARICKQASGSNLYSTVVCWPQGVEESMCWDLLTTGSCPRHKRCRWHHPQPASKMRINVLISEEHKAKKSSEQVLTRSHADRHKLHLNELVQ
jgi:hypothetical protein